MITFREACLHGSPADDLRIAGRAGVDLWWLGQAGFAIRHGGTRLLVDPYLSDSLAVKYRGRPLAHERLMAPPIAPGEMRGVDWCLCSHAHSDHMDPGTLPILAAANPTCRFVVPRASAPLARERGVPPERLVAVNAGETLSLGPTCRVEVIPAAHETLKTDAAGLHDCLGFVLRLGGITLYHSGDCVPFDGLAELLRGLQPDLALLPVNGRDAARTAAGILGNFSFSEAVALCRQARIPWLLAHHVGMFACNTVPSDTLLQAAAASGQEIRIALPSLNTRYEVRLAQNPEP